MILAEEHLLVRDTARAFAQSALAPNAAAWEEARAVPRDVLREMGRLGFLGMTVPEEWGGSGADCISYALALMEIAAGNGAVSTMMSGHNSVGCMPLLDHGTEAQKERWLRPMAQGDLLAAFCLTEPQGGSDAGSIRTRAVRTNSGWRISGVKQYITSGATADLAVVFAVTDPEKGKRGLSGFLVPIDNPGYRVGRVERKMGQSASDTCEIILEDVEVGADALLGAEGAG